jgi:hypothetical protein
MVNPIGIYQLDLIKSFAVFYLIIYSNYVTNIFTCYERNSLMKHKTLQYLIIFIVFYFLVTLLTNTGNLELIPPIQKLIYTFFYFTIFILTTRIDEYVRFFAITCIFIIYFIDLNKTYYIELPTQTKDNQYGSKILDDNRYWITLDYPTRIRMFPVNKSQFDILSYFQNILFYFIIVLLIFGFIAYAGEIKYKLGPKNFTVYNIFIDTRICTIDNTKSIFDYFKMGLGMKL